MAQGYVIVSRGLDLIGQDGRGALYWLSRLYVEPVGNAHVPPGAVPGWGALKRAEFHMVIVGGAAPDVHLKVVKEYRFALRVAEQVHLPG